MEANFSLESGSGNHLQSLSLEVAPPAFPKSVSAPYSLYQTNPFLLEIDGNDLKLSVAYDGKVCLHSQLMLIMGWLGAMM